MSRVLCTMSSYRSWTSMKRSVVSGGFSQSWGMRSTSIGRADGVGVETPPISSWPSRHGPTVTTGAERGSIISPFMRDHPTTWIGSGLRRPHTAGHSCIRTGTHGRAAPNTTRHSSRIGSGSRWSWSHRLSDSTLVERLSNVQLGCARARAHYLSSPCGDPHASVYTVHMFSPASGSQAISRAFV
jgi:hypothetical protein